MSRRYYAVILASGLGVRMGVDTPKQLLKLAGRSVIEHTLEVFESHCRITDIIVVIHPMLRSYLEDLMLRRDYTKIRAVVNGGQTRQDSSWAGLQAIADNEDYVLIHDAVRPIVSHELITRCIEALDEYSAVDVAIKCADTIIETDTNGFVTSIPNRSRLMRGQTPQAFKAGIIRKAHALAKQYADRNFTDDCGLVVKYGLCKVKVIEGEEENIKITYPIDLYIADRLFQLRQVGTKPIDMSRLSGKVIVVFGASRGIGEAIVAEGRKFGAVCYGFSRSNGVDVRKIESIEMALRDVAKCEERIDAVVNTAAILRMGRLVDRSQGDVLDELAVNYVGAINVCKASYSYLRETKGALILFTSSSYTRGRALYSIYSSTKSAIVNLGQALGEEYKEEGVRVIVINPERTATPMRMENFGIEPMSSLLRADHVATVTLRAILSDMTGVVIDAKRNCS
jgi:2-C-methyl-D-erythritol 4-phosphate cytidylyltransferase